MGIDHCGTFPDCCEICRATIGCKAFTYRSGFPGICHLRSKVFVNRLRDDNHVQVGIIDNNEDPFDSKINANFSNSSKNSIFLTFWTRLFRKILISDLYQTKI
jgi:hypothetical protein